MKAVGGDVHLWKFYDDADRREHWAGLSANKDFVEGFASSMPYQGLLRGGDCKAKNLIRYVSSASSSVFDSFRSAVSKPSVNEP